MIAASEWQAIALSLKISGIAAMWVMPPAVLTGWLLARRQFYGKLVVESFVHAPMVMPPVVTGYLLLLLLGRNGCIGRLLNDWFGLNFVFSWQGAALASAVVAFPLAVRSVRLAISMVDRRLEEAAATLGFTPLRVLFSITLPLAWPGILSGMLLAFSRSLGEFGATITFAGNIAGKTQTLPLAIHSALQIPGGEHEAMRLVVGSLLLCAASLILSEVLIRRAQGKRDRGVRS